MTEATRPPAAASRLGSILANPVVPSVYVWAATVGAPCLREGVSAPARAFAALAAACVALAALTLRLKPRFSRVVGVYAFVGCCIATWGFLGDALAPPRLDPIRGVLGGVGWLAFAFGWGAVRRPGTVPEDHPAVLRGRALPSRGTLISAAPVVMVIGLGAAVACLALGFRIDRPLHAVLGHAVALVAAVGMVVVTGRIASRRTGPTPRQTPRARVSHASASLALLSLVLVGGAFVWLLR